MVQLKLKIKRHADGRIYEILLYTKPNAGHGYKPIARFYHEFTDALLNAEHIVALWNGEANISQQVIKKCIKDLRDENIIGDAGTEFLKQKWEVNDG